LTLAELMLALGLLGTILISLVGLFTMLLGSSTKTTNQTIGTAFAQQKLEDAILAGTYSGDENQEFLYAMDSKRQQRFYYKVAGVPISASPGVNGYKGGYWVEVSVYWWDGDTEEARAGQGVLHTTLGRFIYPGVNVP